VPAAFAALISPCGVMSNIWAISFQVIPSCRALWTNSARRKGMSRCSFANDSISERRSSVVIIRSVTELHNDRQ
jgi:hypothetical protein